MPVVGGGAEGDDDAVARKAIADLERQGFIAGDRVQLRFSFEAASLREAVDLSGSLRTGARLRVQIRPAARRLLTTRRWSVIATTPPAPVICSVIRLWEEQMDDVAREHSGCRVVGWKPVMRPALRPAA